MPGPLVVRRTSLLPAGWRWWESIGCRQPKPFTRAPIPAPGVSAVQPWSGLQTCKQKNKSKNQKRRSTRANTRHVNAGCERLRSARHATSPLQWSVCIYLAAKPVPVLKLAPQTLLMFTMHHGHIEYGSYPFGRLAGHDSSRHFGSGMTVCGYTSRSGVMMIRRKNWESAMPAQPQDLSQTLHLEHDCFGI